MSPAMTSVTTDAITIATAAMDLSERHALIASTRLSAMTTALVRRVTAQLNITQTVFRIDAINATPAMIPAMILATCINSAARTLIKMSKIKSTDTSERLSAVS